jgi:hypothetical protein
MKETIIAKGKLFELIHEVQPDGRVFERARRAPGVRLIIADRDKGELLLTKEFRKELNDWDYRLPGGKVFDSLDEYEQHRNSGDDIVVAARKKATEEACEEAGILVEDLSLFRESTLGATVEWDLYVFEVGQWRAAEGGQKLEEGEIIEADSWFKYDDVSVMILKGEMKEDRIALIVLQWIAKQKEKTV